MKWNCKLRCCVERFFFRVRLSYGRDTECLAVTYTTIYCSKSNVQNPVLSYFFSFYSYLRIQSQVFLYSRNNGSNTLYVYLSVNTIAKFSINRVKYWRKNLSDLLIQLESCAAKRESCNCNRSTTTGMT